MKAYCYSALGDKIRVKLFRRISEYDGKFLGWSYNVFHRDGRVTTRAKFCDTKREAKAELVRRFGELRSITIDPNVSVWEHGP